MTTRRRVTFRWHIIEALIADCEPAWWFFFWIIVAWLLAFIGSRFLPNVNQEDVLSVRVRQFGTLLQLLGVFTVVWGLHETRKLFNLPPLRRGLSELVRRLRSAFTPPEPIVIKVNSGIMAVDAVGAELRVRHGAGSTLEDRVAALENNLKELEREIEARTAEFLKKQQAVTRGLHDQERASKESDRALQKQIEAVTIGGLRLEVLGLVWLTIGTICTGIPGEAAWLITRVFGSV